MDGDMTPEVIAALLGGLVIAAITAPVGVSGAVFLLPFQVSILAVPSPAVTPTNLLFNVISVPGALARYRRHGTLRTSLTGQLLVGTLPGVVVGACVRVFVIPEAGIFRVLVALLLLPLGISLLVKARSSGRSGSPKGAIDRSLSVPVVIAMGAAAGVIGGVYGIGGGSLLAPLLVVLGCSPSRVAPAALASTFITSCVGVAAYVLLAQMGEVAAAPAWEIAVAAGIGGLVGGYLGAAAQPYVPVRLLTGALGVVSVAVALFYLNSVL
ncbi:MAG TPA: sulfite exporter TauE/SafE family protein [Actinomycetota bacterium]|nr:sulfite exporter TauE/SafE family protein [Actinomycetota bacterium]